MQAVLASWPPVLIRSVSESLESPKTEIESLVLVDRKASGISRVFVGRVESGINERKVRNQRLPGTVSGDRGPITFILDALKRGHPATDTISHDLVHDVPGSDRWSHALDFLLDVLWDNCAGHLAGRERAGEPGLERNFDHETQQAREEFSAQVFVNAKRYCGRGKCCHSR